MEIVVLGSGSAGNSTLVRCGSTSVLVDSGLSARQIELRLATIGASPGDLQGILLTHEHTDHTSGLKVLLRKWSIPIYCNSGTARAIGGAPSFPGARFQLFETGQRLEIGGLKVTPFPVPHDATDPVGFRIEADSAAFGVLTDLGYATKLVTDTLRGVHGLLIEANYDEQLLQNDSKRPWSVKQRIASRHGHLSNTAAAGVIAALQGDTLSQIVLCHLSRDCNTPELALSTIHTPSSACCATQDQPTDCLRIG